MTDIQTLKNRMEAVIDLYRNDKKLTNVKIISVLELVKLNIYMESVNCDET